MNINDIKKALPYLFKTKITPMIVGAHGTGKSTGVREFASENDFEFVDLRLGSMDVGDLLGLPDFTGEGARKRTSFMSPDWFPKDPSSRGIIFLDEINRARRDVLQAVFQLVLDRKMHDKELPKEWYVVAACNPDTEDYTVTDTSDKALMDRFCHIKVTSSYQDFLGYGKAKNFDEKVLRFISAQPTLLRGSAKDFSLDYVQPSDRSWEMVSRLMSAGITEARILNELISGLVGTEASVAYLSFMENEEKPIKGKDIVKKYDKQRAKVQSYSTVENYRSDLLTDTANSVLEYLHEVNGVVTEKEYKNLIQFALDIPNDVTFPFLQKFIEHKDIFLKMIEEKEIEKKIEKYDKTKAPGAKTKE